MLKNFFKKITGLDVLEKEIQNVESRYQEVLDKTAQAVREQVRAEQAEEAAKEAERVAKLTPKERATEAKEPWVAVLDTHVNKENVKNGFFELDWNEYFVLQLREAGYKGDTDEAVVDLWFQELCKNVGAEAGVDMERRGSGFINVNDLGNGKSEVS
jgi:hypothetical protein